MWDLFKEQMKKMGIERELQDELRSGIALARARSEREQARLAAANARNPRRGLEGMGQFKLSMDPMQRAIADVMFGQGWTKDKATVRKLLQTNPEFGVPYAKKSTVSVIKP